MSLLQSISNAMIAIGTDIKNILTRILPEGGTVGQVVARTEDGYEWVTQGGGGGTIIDDSEPAIDKTYSSSKVEALVAAVAPAEGGFTELQALQLAALTTMFPNGIPTGVPELTVLEGPFVTGLSVEMTLIGTNLLPGFVDTSGNGIPNIAGAFAGETEVDWGDGVTDNGAGFAGVNSLSWAHEYGVAGTYTISGRIRNHIGWSEPLTQEVTVA